MKSVEIRAPGDIVKDFLLDPYLVLRLNPSWFVQKIQTDERDVYSVTLYDDRTDETRQIILQVRVSKEAANYQMNSDTIVFLMHTVNPVTTRLSISGGFFRGEDLPYWLKGLKNYIQLATRHRSFMKWFLDRVWLRMTPSQRRIAFIVILAEGIGFAALIAVIIALKILRYLS